MVTRWASSADAARSPFYDQVPTFRENGVDLIVGGFHGVYVPKGTPQDVIDKLADAIGQAMKSDQVIANMNNVGAGITFMRGEEANKFLATQDATYRAIIEKLGLRVAPAK
jgi:tripartite-type tricarboxylate transporter receptor subunit TctC